MENIARRFFCPAEASELLSLPRPERAHAFFLCWTRKEAYIKATGNGLSTPLDSFRVALDPTAPARFLDLPESAGAWTLHNLIPESGYAGALAYPGPARTLSLHGQFNPLDPADGALKSGAGTNAVPSKG